MELKKRELILIIITVILVIVLGVGFYYDRTGALLDRTNAIEISQDPNLKLEKINKVGFLFARQSYEARFRIVNNKWDSYYNVISTAYGGGGGFCGIEGYKQYEEQALSKNSIKPNPKSDALIWILGSKLGKDTNKNIVYIIDQENDGNSYLYVYYSRK
jgi:hypothetical protein